MKYIQLLLVRVKRLFKIKESSGFNKHYDKILNDIYASGSTIGLSPSDAYIHAYAQTLEQWSFDLAKKTKNQH